MKLIVKHPHIKEHHVKHMAGFGIVSGTILEAAHMFYPSGLLLLMFAGCVAVYEPYIVHHVQGELPDEH